MNARSRRLPTIRDVASTAGVSPTTVSNVLNGRTAAMRGETLQRVREAIRDLGFRPSALARGLVSRVTSTIGIVLSEIETPLFLQALPQMERIARNAEHNVLFCAAHGEPEEKEAIELLLEKQVDGIVFFSISEYRKDDYLAMLAQVGIPTVLVNRATESSGVGHVRWDQKGGVVEVVEHLVGLGHRRIAHMMGPTTRRSSHERLEGYRQGLLQSEIDCIDEYVVDGDFTKTPEDWRESVLRLLNNRYPPSALIASDDNVASVAVRTIQSCGMQVPGDVSVIGIDDQPFCPFLNPPLTTLRLPILESGQLAIEMVLAALSGASTVAQTVVLPCRLIRRESSGPSRAAS